MKVRFNNNEMGAAANQAGGSLPGGSGGLPALRKPTAGSRRTTRGCGGFSIEEVVVSRSASALTIGGVATVRLDLPEASGTLAYVAKRIAITSLSMNPPRQVIQEDSSWSFLSRDPSMNAMTPYRSP